MKNAVVIRHVAFEDLGILAAVLTGRGYTFRYVEAGLHPVDHPSVRDADLLVVLGGPIGIGDAGRYPYLAEEITTVRDRIDRRRPVLGVCLGAQIIAAALGAHVGPAGGAEIGYAPLRLTPDGQDSVLAPLGVTPVLHWHGDEFQIPDGARRLAETPGYPNQAFSYGPTVLALQFHLEADHTRLEQWLIGHAHELATNRVDLAALRDDARRHGPALADLGRAVFERWLDRAGTGSA
ncbi:glutamine amidotransferase [Jidongwangia harbinensis]|uniref:glutamine amidotransferase n=1 Tax=Jidongwangia harbinensis TaxID=2878561 RepID=UPI001CDA2201|nr:glutamine amidotransferase [Jidongwangia harbinensis]MCA2212164.1 glutamine amidotransferase [Jidongwangia harbinensis]